MACVACTFVTMVGWQGACSPTKQLGGVRVDVTVARVPLPLVVGIVAVVLCAIVALVALKIRHKSDKAVRVRPTVSRDGTLPATVAPPEMSLPSERRAETGASQTSTQEPERKPPAHMRRRFLHIESYSDKGGREANEDTVGEREFDDAGRKSVCVAVADGLGGHAGGDRASQVAVRTILDEWDPLTDENGLATIFEHANQAVCRVQTPMSDMRTTAVALSLANGRALWANAGDSRLYHFRNGELAFQTLDHSVPQMMVMLGQIESDQIRDHEDRARLTKALGQEGTLSCDVGMISISRDADDVFLLCTDGFWEFVLEEEMTSTLSEATSPSDWLGRMRALHDERAPVDCDNNSAVAVWLTARLVKEA